MKGDCGRCPRMGKTRICADCLMYRSEDRFHGSCSITEPGGPGEIDESRNRRVIRWNDKACKRYICLMTRRP